MHETERQATDTARSATGEPEGLDALNGLGAPHAAEADPERLDQPLAQPLSPLLPADLIDPSETILIMMRPSPWAIPLAMAGWTTGVIVLGFVLHQLVQQGMLGPLHVRDVTVGVVALIAVRLTWRVLDWLSRFYVLTDKRVIVVRGVTRLIVKQAPLSHFEGTALTTTPRERLAGLATLVFEPANPETPRLRWHMIANPVDVQEAVDDAITRYRL